MRLKPLNSTISDAFRYHRQTLAVQEIQEALDDYDALADAVGWFEFDSSNARDEIQKLVDFKEDNEDTIADAEAALRFVEDIKRVYEDRHGRIFDTPLDTLVQWIHDDLQRVPDEETK